MRTIDSLLVVSLFTSIAVGGDPPSPTKSPELKRFSERFLALVRDPTPTSFRAVADVPRMSADAKAFIRRIDAKGDVVDDRLVEEWLVSLEPVCDPSWESAEVKNVLATKDSVSKVRIRLKSSDGAQSDFLGSIIVSGGERRLIDLQTLPSGMSVAKQTSLLFAGEHAQELALEFQANAAGLRGDPRPALFRIAALGREPLRLYRDRCCLEWAGEADRPKEVLRLAEKLDHRFDEDASVAWLSAKAHYHLDQHRECNRCLEWYESLAGKDSWSRLLRAKSLKLEGRFAEARRECSGAVNDDPSSVEAAIELFEVTPAREKAKAAELLPKDDAFEIVAWTLGSALGSAGDVPGLNAVVDHAEKIGSTDNVMAYLRGELLLAQGKPAEAAEALVKHLPDDDEEADDADDILDLYCEAMHRSGKAESAYKRASSTPKKAFASIADKIDEVKDAATLEKIGALHCVRHPGDGSGVLSFATFLFHRKKLQDAASTIERFLSLPGAERSEHREQLRELRLRILLVQDKLADALRFIGDDEKLFNFAAEDLADSGRGTDLVKLLDGFAPRASNVAAFTNWKAESAFLSKNYQLAFAYLVQLADPNGPTRTMEIDARRRLVFIRTIVRIGNRTGLDRLAEKILEPDDELAFALAYAAVGDVKKLEVALESCLEAGISERGLLDDPDLGPMLQAPTLTKVRDKVLLDRELNP